MIERKIKLRNFLRAQNTHIDESVEKCIDKCLSIDVCFYLFNGSTETGRSRKDLDNLLKILCDVLPESMVGDGNVVTGKEGLGLLRNNADDAIYEIHCMKRYVSSIEDEGLDCAIFEWSDVESDGDKPA